MQHCYDFGVNNFTIVRYCTGNSFCPCDRTALTYESTVALQQQHVHTKVTNKTFNNSVHVHVQYLIMARRSSSKGCSSSHAEYWRILHPANCTIQINITEYHKSEEATDLMWRLQSQRSSRKQVVQSNTSWQLVRCDQRVGWEIIDRTKQQNSANQNDKTTEALAF